MSSGVLTGASGPERALGTRAWVALIVFLCLVPLSALATRDLWKTGELRYAEATRQIGAYGHVVVPHLNGEVYGEKPPFYFWSGVAARTLLGGDRWGATAGGYAMGARLVSWLALLGSTALVIVLGHTVFSDRRVGWLAGAVFASTTYLVVQSQTAMIDPLLSCLALAGTVGWVRAALATTTRAKVGWASAATLALVCASLTKGPVGLLCAAIGALALGLTFKGREGVSVSAISVGAAVTIGVTLLWLYAASLEAGDAYWDRMFSKQLRDRVVKAPRHQEPFYFYLVELPKLMLPWVVFVPGAGLLAYRQRRVGPDGRAAFGLVLWALVGFAFFSLISGKRLGYVMPLVPALALLIAYGVCASTEARDDPQLRWLLPIDVLPWVCSLAGGVALLAAAVLPLLPASLLDKASLEELPSATPVLGVLVGAGSLAIGWWLRAKHADRSAKAAGVAAVTGLALSIVFLAGYPAMNRDRAVRFFAEELQRTVPEGARLVLVPSPMQGRISLYTGVERYETCPDLEQALDGPLPVWVAALRKDYRRADPKILERYRLVIDAPLRRGKSGQVLLVSK